MARTKAALGTGARLSDYLSASLLARVYPTERVEQILDEQGVNSQRIRSLPASVMAYYCLALSLYPRQRTKKSLLLLPKGLPGRAVEPPHRLSPNPPSAPHAANWAWRH